MPDSIGFATPWHEGKFIIATSSVHADAPRPPRWHRIIRFPLVAMLIAIGLFLFATRVAGAMVDQSGLPRGDMRGMFAGAMALFMVVLVYKFGIRRLGEEPRDELGAARALPDFGLGLAGGFLLFSLIVGIAALGDLYNIVGEGSIARLPFTLVVVAIAPAFIEEILFRGILFRFLEQFGGSWFALLLTSALFGTAHIVNPNASLFSSFAIAVEAGLMLGGAYMLTRSLWAPIGLHAAWNFTQGFIYDVPVSGMDQQGLVEARLSGPELLSGGAFGLEASLIATFCATLAGIWLIRRAVRAGQIVRPWWVRRRLAKADPGTNLAEHSA